MGVADHRNFLVSFAEFFFLWAHNNLQHQSTHQGENYALEHLSHVVLYGQNGHHEGFGHVDVVPHYLTLEDVHHTSSP
jgi:hypothetical protein